MQLVPLPHLLQEHTLGPVPACMQCCSRSATLSEHRNARALRHIATRFTLPMRGRKHVSLKEGTNSLLPSRSYSDSQRASAAPHLTLTNYEVKAGMGRACTGDDLGEKIHSLAVHEPAENNDSHCKRATERPLLAVEHAVAGLTLEEGDNLGQALGQVYLGRGQASGACSRV
jgi:hypothetical protein